MNLRYPSDLTDTERVLLKDLPPWSTVHGYRQLRAWHGTLARLH